MKGKFDWELVARIATAVSVALFVTLLTPASLRGHFFDAPLASTASNILRVLLVAAAFVAAIIFSSSKNGNRVGLVVIGIVFASFGVSGFITGEIPQRWHAGAPLEGPAARVGSSLLVIYGVYVIYRAARMKTGGADSKK